MVEMHQAMAHGFDTNEVVMYGLMPATEKGNSSAQDFAFTAKSVK